MWYYILKYDWSVSSTLIGRQLVTRTTICSDIASDAILLHTNSGLNLASIIITIMKSYETQRKLDVK